jgi:succinate dehydrogenase / fumarate reductase cytochrome b subunit
LGSVFLVCWLVAIASGPQAYAAAQGFFGGIIGRLLLFLFSFSLFYHTLNGIRHLIWDANIGLRVDKVEATSKLVVGLSIVLTILVWIVAYAMH